MIQFKTGRTYDTKQVLEITIEQDQEDEYGLQNVTATFTDASRHIAGRVQTVVFPTESIGEAVLKEYDAGRYVII